jgi:hypothetical protein
MTGSGETDPGGEGVAGSVALDLDWLKNHRRTLGALCLYAMEADGDTVEDHLGLEPPLLRTTVPGVPDPVPDRGSEFILTDQGRFFSTPVPVERMIGRIRTASVFTVEAVLRTGQLDQQGPARIVTVSESPDARNFTLGQSGQSLVFRVRSPMAGPNGSRIRLVSEKILQKDRWHHIAAVYHRGLERFFVDGRPGRRIRCAHIDYLPAILGLGTALISKIVLGFIILFPAAFSLCFVLPAGKRPLAPVLVTTIVFIIQCVYQLLIRQPFDGWTLAGAFIIGWCGFMTASKIMN